MYRRNRPRGELGHRAQPWDGVPACYNTGCVYTAQTGGHVVSGGCRISRHIRHGITSLSNIVEKAGARLRGIRKISGIAIGELILGSQLVEVVVGNTLELTIL